MTRSRRVVVDWSREVGDMEECFEAEVSVYLGTSRPIWDRGNGMWLPPEPPEVEIIELRDDAGPRPDVLDLLSDADRGRIEEAAFDRASEPADEPDWRSNLPGE